MRTRTGEDLRVLREQAGLSQTKAAEMTGTPLRTWQRWEAKTESAYRRPPGMAFAFLEFYISMKTGTCNEKEAEAKTSKT